MIPEAAIAAGWLAGFALSLAAGAPGDRRSFGGRFVDVFVLEFATVVPVVALANLGQLLAAMERGDVARLLGVVGGFTALHLVATLPITVPWCLAWTVAAWMRRQEAFTPVRE